MFLILMSYCLIHKQPTRNIFQIEHSCRLKLMLYAHTRLNAEKGGGIIDSPD